MPASLLELMEALLQAIEQRDAGDPDAPAWEVCAQIEQLERELASRILRGEGAAGVGDIAPAAQAGRTDEALVGV